MRPLSLPHLCSYALPPSVQRPCARARAHRGHWGALQVTLQFPAVLERLALPAFDLCKLVGPFVRHEPTLPRELKRHLFSIEERVCPSFTEWSPLCNGALSAPLGSSRVGRSGVHRG